MLNSTKTICMENALTKATSNRCITSDQTYVCHHRIDAKRWMTDIKFTFICWLNRDPSKDFCWHPSTIISLPVSAVALICSISGGHYDSFTGICKLYIFYTLCKVVVYEFLTLAKWTASHTACWIDRFLYSI